MNISVVASTLLFAAALVCFPGCGAVPLSRLRGSEHVPHQLPLSSAEQSLPLVPVDNVVDDGRAQTLLDEALFYVESVLTRLKNRRLDAIERIRARLAGEYIPGGSDDARDENGAEEYHDDDDSDGDDDDEYLRSLLEEVIREQHLDEPRPVGSSSSADDNDDVRDSHQEQEESALNAAGLSDKGALEKAETQLLERTRSVGRLPTTEVLPPPGWEQEGLKSHQRLRRKFKREQPKLSVHVSLNVLRDMLRANANRRQQNAMNKLAALGRR